MTPCLTCTGTEVPAYPKYSQLLPLQILHSICTDLLGLLLTQHVPVQLHDKAKVIIAKLRQEMQAKQKHMKQLQASRDEVGAVAEGYNRIITKLEPVASQGRMMAALLEMLHSSLSLPASHMLGSPLQQFETLIADYTALRSSFKSTTCVQMNYPYAILLVN